MLFRFSVLAAGLFALAGCSLFSHHAKNDPSPVTEAPTSQAPADAFLQITLADVSRQDVAARTVAEERIQPVGASPVDFLLSYDPADLRDGVDFAINVRLQQGDKLLAINDARVSVLGRSGENGPVSITLKATP
jgi:putative lipoprotein